MRVPPRMSVFPASSGCREFRPCRGDCDGTVGSSHRVRRTSGRDASDGSVMGRVTQADYRLRSSRAIGTTGPVPSEQQRKEDGAGKKSE